MPAGPVRPVRPSSTGSPGPSVRLITPRGGPDGARRVQRSGWNESCLGSRAAYARRRMARGDRGSRMSQQNVTQVRTCPADGGDGPAVRVCAVGSAGASPGRRLAGGRRTCFSWWSPRCCRRSAATWIEGLSEVLTSFPGFLTGAVAERVLAGGRVVGRIAGHRGLPAARAARPRGVGRGGARLGDLGGRGGDRVRRTRRCRSAGWLDSDGPPVFPPAALAITSAVIAVMAPYPDLAVPPFRAGADRRPDARARCSSGSRYALGAVAAWAIGLLAGTAMHLLRGSPGGFPTVTRVKAALADLGVDVEQLAPTAMRREGVAVLSGSDRRGGHRGQGVRARRMGGRAARRPVASRLVSRATAQRSSEPRRVRRARRLHHHARVARRRPRCPRWSPPDLADNGDALIAVRPDGTPLGHRRRRAHRRRRCGRCGTSSAASTPVASSITASISIASSWPTVTAGFGDLSSASVRSDELDAIADRAQLFALTRSPRPGSDVAIDQAKSAIGRDGFVAVLPYLQEASLPPFVRASVARPAHRSRHGPQRARRAARASSDVELVKRAAGHVEVVAQPRPARRRRLHDHRHAQRARPRERSAARSPTPTGGGCSLPL